MQSTPVMPYVFTPTERSATNLDEFLAICRDEPGLAEQHLRAGWFNPWLRDAGYARLADAAAAQPALDVFLAAASTRRPAAGRRPSASTTPGRRKRAA